MATIRTSIQINNGMTPALRSITNALNITLSSFEALQNASHNAIDTASIQAARRELNNAEIAFNGVEDSIGQATTQQQGFNNKLKEGTQSSSRLLSNIKGFVGAYLGMQGLKMGIGATDNYVNTAARLGLINDGLQTQAELQQKIFDAAERSRGKYSDMNDTVAKLGMLAGDAFKSNDEMIGFAETMQKAFKLSGASAQEQSSAMYQLNQAMAAGKLQGDEFRSITENAPLLSKAIADFTGKTKGELKEMSSDGLITADIIKGAVFNMADDVNAKFGTLPVTFGDAAKTIQNNAIRTFESTMVRVNNILNKPVGMAMVENIKRELEVVKGILSGTLYAVEMVGGFFATHWSKISPIIWGVTGALTAYNLALMASSVAKAINIGWQTAQALALAVTTVATVAQAAEIGNLTVAQWALNSAIFASPLFWIGAAIVAIVAGFAAWTFYTYGLETGLLVLQDTALTLFENFKEGWMVTTVFFQNGWANMMIAATNATARIKNLFGNMKVSVLTSIEDMVNKAIDAFNRLISGFNSVAGTSFDMIGHVQVATSYAASKKVEQAEREKARSGAVTSIHLDMARREQNLSRLSNSNIQTQARRAAAIEASKIKTSGAAGSAFSPNLADYPAMLGDIGDTAKNTGAMKDALEMSEEDIKALRDLAERDIIDRTVLRDISINMDNSFGDIRETADVDGIISEIETRLEQAIEASAEGGY